ncbi:hypothetical protein KOM00_08785 [Geomonas sp. Red69]|uniref:YXWGXW repeat-containing protein n=1 Tax=Geomonas diazotrophica TaxID=2843197 RepID=A0ABX8JP24_9BACT|nr:MULTISPECIES: hypothetical protein [Geomonas]MBU5636828.1 hypothetical protein [Geomonas diazotrophica]QWV98364.1 hypothetical protein KP005_03480 [Geomonas nitrogeniifigens]QXE87546.1 hypothetical protein KP003_03840 [Geomonas nitrogeniifigens]
MKKLIALAFVIVLAGAATAQARVDFSVNIGIPVAPVPVAPPPVVYPAPAPVVYPPPVAPVAYAEPPSFIYSPALGFYVSVGLPYDVVYMDNGYYQYRDGYWYVANSYRGPWTYVAPRRLPYGLHQHRYEQIRYYRDHEYRTYLSDRDHYRGNWYRPVAERRDGRWGERKDYYRDGYRDGRRDNRWDDRRDDRRDNRRDDRRDYRDRH